MNHVQKTVAIERIVRVLVSDMNGSTRTNKPGYRIRINDTHYLALHCTFNPPYEVRLEGICLIQPIHPSWLPPVDIAGCRIIAKSAFREVEFCDAGFSFKKW